jgi:hypothetical protein
VWGGLNILPNGLVYGKLSDSKLIIFKVQPKLIKS